MSLNVFCFIISHDVDIVKGRVGDFGVPTFSELAHAKRLLTISFNGQSEIVHEASRELLYTGSSTIASS